jgi:hypothetical protein
MASQFHFIIKAQIAHMTIDDIVYFAFVRTPITKRAGFALLKCYLSQVMANQIQADLNKNEFFEITISIYMYDELTNQQTKFISDRKLYCIGANIDTTLRFEEDREYITLTLVHPILYYLGNHNTFNVIMKDVTAYDVLNAFQGDLARYGDIFQFKHLGISKTLNSYVYEQILTRASNDLAMPDYLINTYKVNNSFCFYFFDPFYIHPDATHEIVCHYINLEADEEFVKDDIQKWSDMKMTTNHICEKQFNDIPQNFIDKLVHRLILNQQEMKTKYTKEPIDGGLPHRDPPVTKKEILISEKGERSIKSVIEKSVYSLPQGRSSASSIFYCPDSVANAETRYTSSKNLIQETLKSVHYFEMSNCLPDYPQFGHKYNIEEHNSESVFTPLNIVNIFYRKVFKEPNLYHISKTVMMKCK